MSVDPTCGGCHGYSLYDIFTGKQLELLPPLEVDAPLRKADQIADLLLNSKYGDNSYDIIKKSIDNGSPRLRTMTIDVVLK